jgi:flagellar biosynthesis protein FlhB
MENALPPRFYGYQIMIEKYKITLSLVLASIVVCFTFNNFLPYVFYQPDPNQKEFLNTVSAGFASLLQGVAPLFFLVFLSLSIRDFPKERKKEG